MWQERRIKTSGVGIVKSAWMILISAVSGTEKFRLLFDG